MLTTLIAALVMQQPAPPLIPKTLAEANMVAWQDCRTLPPEVAKRTRYVWLGPRFTQEQWPDAWRVADWHVNKRSRSPGIEQLRKLTCGNMAALYLPFYGDHWPEVWETLSKVEPYWKIHALRDKTKVDIYGPWLTRTKDEREALEGLTAATKSAVPVVRADWFVWQTAVGIRSPGYYEFLGIKNEKDFDDAVGFNAASLKKFPMFLREAMSESAVSTERVRRIDAVGVIGGWYFFTSDLKEDPDAPGYGADSNPLLRLGEKFEYDGRESLANLPNGLQASGAFQGNRKVKNDKGELVSKQGQLAKFVPTELAADSTKPAHSNDHRIHVDLGCVRCHGPFGGYQPIDGFVRGTTALPGGIKSPDIKEISKLRFLYQRPMEFALESARMTYQRATGECTGKTVEQMSELYRKLYEDYDRPLSVDDLCLEVGAPKDEFLKKLRLKASRGPEVSTVLNAFVGPQSKEEYDLLKSKGAPVAPIYVPPKRLPRIVAHEIFPEAMVHWTTD